MRRINGRMAAKVATTSKTSLATSLVKEDWKKTPEQRGVRYDVFVLGFEGVRCNFCRLQFGFGVYSRQFVVDLLEKKWGFRQA